MTITAKDKKNKTPSYNTPAISLGFNMVAGMLVFTYLGYWLDKKHGGQLWTLLGIFLGLTYCGYEVWKLVRNNKKSE